ncbi:MAG: MBL fold metallo-hydrolase [Thermodesulfobacteriota bacterium]|nr:MBL fold metallo-hydrolase [Thermodesulfobacteriota bacterium]
MQLTENVYYYPENGMLDANTYIIKDRENIIIDIGFENYFPELFNQMGKDGFSPEDIGIVTNTHIHLDHYSGNKAFKDVSGARVLVHPLFKEHYEISAAGVARMFGVAPVPLTDDGELSPDIFEETEFKIFNTPGHSQESLCFYSQKLKVLICGDLIFKGNTGRVDFPGGNPSLLKEHIGKMAKLEIEMVLPGHMEYVKGREEVIQNFKFIEEFVLNWL